MESEGQTPGTSQTPGKRARVEVAGTGDNYEFSFKTKSLAHHIKYIDAKVVRYIAATYGIGDKALQALAIVDTWLILFDRVNVGGSQDVIVDWSGARPNWKRRIAEGIKECLMLGVLERFPKKNGHAIDKTTKGARILEAYARRFEEIKEELEERKEGNRRKKAA